MGYYAIGALIVVAGALGVAYVAINPFDSEQDETEQAAVADVQKDEPAEAAPASKPAIVGSAARRMDDFGTGPSGTTVTVPLKGRHQQAFSGSNAGGGGGPAKTSDGGTPDADIETAAIVPETAEDQDAVAKPSFRVIERDVDDQTPADEDTAVEADADIAPSFDVVRVDPEGRSVIAGRAAPLSEVEIKAGDEVIDRVTASPSGEWVSTPADPLASGDQELSLTAVPGEGASVHSRQIVVVSVPEGRMTRRNRNSPSPWSLTRTKAARGAFCRPRTNCRVPATSALP